MMYLLIAFTLGLLVPVLYVWLFKPWRYWLHLVAAWCAAHNIWWERYRSPRRDEFGARDTGYADFWAWRRWGFKWTREFTYWWVNESAVQRWVRAYNAVGWEWWRARGTPYDTILWRIFRASLEWSNWYRGGDVWKWPWQPRTCSYDGGVHPEDAIRLLREGWEVDGTDKGYKHYMHPPGHTARMAAWSAFNRLGGELPPDGWSPVPPVKVYSQHFSDEQRARFNATLRARFEKLA